jgi:formamidopyrimidine-DNA glycosylase
MPELPEVEAGRRLAEIHAKGKTITKVIAADDESTRNTVPCPVHGFTS